MARPDLKDMELLIEVLTRLQQNNANLSIVAKELRKPVSSVFALVKEAEDYYGKDFTNKNGAITLLTDNGKNAIKAFQNILQLSNTLGFTKTPEVRIVTTLSLKNRLFPMVLTAFAMYLKDRKISQPVNVVIDNENNESIVRRVVHDSQPYYHFGVCWTDHRHLQNDKLEFHKIASRFQSQTNPFATPMIAITPLLKYSTTPVALKELFYQSDSIELDQLIKVVKLVKAIHINEEPIDELREKYASAIKQMLESGSQPAPEIVTQYEECIFRIRSLLQADLAIVPAFFQHRNHIEPRWIVKDNKPVTREIQFVFEQPRSWENRKSIRDAMAFPFVAELLVLFRELYSDANIAENALGMYKPTAGLRGRKDTILRSDPFFEMGPEKIFQWLKDREYLKEGRDGDTRFEDDVAEFRAM
jgi:hypothetical protein